MMWTQREYVSGIGYQGIAFDPPRLCPQRRGLYFRTQSNTMHPSVWTIDPKTGDLKLRKVDDVFWPVVPSAFRETDRWQVVPLTEESIPVMLDLPFLLDADRAELVRVSEWLAALRIWIPWANEGRLLAVPRDPSNEEIKHKIPAQIGEHVVQHRIPMDEWTTRHQIVYRQTKSWPTVSVEESTLEPLRFLDRYNAYCPLRLYSQQLVGVHAILRCKRLPVWYDMRVGKTPLSMTAAKYALRNGLVRRIFIICPVPNLYDPWMPTAEMFDLKGAVLDGTAAEDAEVLADESIEVVITNYERVISRLSTEDVEGAFLILDETSAVKNPKARRTRAILAIAHAATYAVPLNGTPLEQGPEDYWSQMRLVDFWGVLWGRTPEDYYREWLTVNRKGKTVAIDDDLFQQHITATSLRCIRSEADQHAGKDSNFRYIALKPTEEHIERSKAATLGMAESFEGDGGAEQMSVNLLACLTHLRQIASGQWKTQEGEGLPFLHQPLACDPKLTWLRAHYLTTREPLVIYTEFNQQEHAAKALFDSLDVPWAGMQGRGHVVKRTRCRERVPRQLAMRMLGDVRLQIAGGRQANTGELRELMVMGEAVLRSQISVGLPEIMIPPHLRYDLGIGEFLRFHAPEFLMTYDALEFDSYDAKEKAEQVRSFNEGRAEVFLMKHSQARGMSLARLPAIKEGRSAPTIVHLSAPWSLGAWLQSNDRCVGEDPRTKKNLYTSTYALSIAGSIDDQIMKALRAKKEVQETLLADVGRNGFTSFVSNLIDGMEEARNGDLFDAEEIEDRLALGIPPTARLTRKTVLRWASDKFECAQKDVVDVVESRPELQGIWDRIQGKVKS